MGGTERLATLVGEMQMSWIERADGTVDDLDQAPEAADVLGDCPECTRIDAVADEAANVGSQVGRMYVTGLRESHAGAHEPRGTA